MKAILIDVTAQTVTDIELETGLSAMYKAIGCDCVDRITIDTKNDLWLDDSGLLQEPQPPKFQFGQYPHLLAGNGLICGYTRKGETVSTTLRAEQAVCSVFGDVHVEPQEPLIITWSDL